MGPVVKLPMETQVGTSRGSRRIYQTLNVLLKHGPLGNVLNLSMVRSTCYRIKDHCLEGLLLTDIVRWTRTLPSAVFPAVFHGR